jgi:serine/threonine protein phosphatase PrpC
MALGSLWCAHGRHCDIGTHARTQQSETRTVKSLILVLACDGLWDKLSNEEVGEIVRTQVCAEADLYQTAELLMKTSYDKGSTDNISVMVIDLSPSLSSTAA